MATRHLPPKPLKKPVQTPQRQKPKDPVEVYCRLRPLKNDESESCAQVISPTTLQLTPPECSLAYKSCHYNPTQHIFKLVFKEKSMQKDVFNELAFPLVEDLVQGKNGLLFAYGVTNSGKTYTITGEQDQPGILPRVLDVLFNSITDVQAPKCVFRPNHHNSFNIVSEGEAKILQQQLKPKKISPRARAELPEYGDKMRVPENRKVGGVDEDSSYAVFISYIEIYNNFVYDLLEEPDTGLHPKPPQSKIMREDNSRNMYISNVVEVEVKTMEEAYEVLLQGQRRRRVAQTQLNHDSSRSHAVFNIRLVQAPLDPTGADVLQDVSKMNISQLSLVDLAGSERVLRTCNEGSRLKEAGNINQSLMVLRTCMETLRDNQRTGANKIVPYRDSKLTHLFKNNFDGEGKVRMIVCVSPQAEDYDESIHVMKFAEVTQEVAVDRPTIVKADVPGLAPGRRRANMIYKAVIKDTNEGSPPATPHPYEVALGVFCLHKYVSENFADHTLAELKLFLDNRVKIREQLLEDFKNKVSSFRSLLISQEEEIQHLRIKCQEVQSQRTSKERAQKETSRMKGIITSQERQIAHLSAEVETYKRKLHAKEKELVQVNEQLSKAIHKNEYLAKANSQYESQLLHSKKLTDQQLIDKTNIKRELEGCVSRERERFEKLARKMEVTEKQCLAKEEKLSQVRDLIRNSPLSAARTQSIPNTPLRAEKIKDNKTQDGTAPLYTKGKGQRKRSLSENWLEHNPPDSVDNGDLLQPSFKKKKTIINPKTKHFKSKQVDKYVLKHQEQDSEGEVKTELYKGDIMITRTGGASVKFTDIEKLNHASPQKPPRRITRSMSRKVYSPSSSMSSSDVSTSIQEESEWTDVETRCAVGIEGRPGATPAFSHIAVKK